ncbi:hypothetical protein [uncultured Kriegella sp.]|uniref:hypothetical protein n=1 Tax=uncultured Kriegella sp. TaxID=1798910 RepID=UPI0030D7755F|tara:strand:+ start:12922 stop:13140 length:219 start_codon:yes stop_codon:yes gene_type:complete
MKNTAMFWVMVTTLILVTITIMVLMDFSSNWVFYITVLGQIMVVYMVYKVLTDNYSTSKTFEDFYSDHPMRS